MALTANEDYIYVPNVRIMEGFTTGTTTSACMICTRDHIIFVPLSSEGVAGLRGRTAKYDIGDEDPAAFAEAVLADPEMTVDGLVGLFRDLLADDKYQRVFPVDELEKFKVKTGLFTGGMFWKMPGEAKKNAHIPGKPNKVAVKTFYEGRFK